MARYGPMQGAAHANMTHNCSASVLPVDLWVCVLAKVDEPEQRKRAALVCKVFSAAARATWPVRVVDLSIPTKRAIATSFPAAATNVVLVSGPEETAEISAIATQSDEYDSKAWDVSGRRRVGCKARWHLAKLVKSMDHGPALTTKFPADSTPQRRLVLTLAIPSLSTSLRELEAMLSEVGALALFSEVSIPRGLATLDGALAARLTRCNTLGHSLTACLSAPAAYSRLADLTVKVQSSEEAAGLLPHLSPATLPALRRLTLVAPSGTAASADFSDLAHPHLTALILHGVRLNGGFACVQHLAGLVSLSLGYEEDEGPSVNLDGDITALAGLQQLSRLRVQSLASDEGLRSLTRLTSLSVSPEGDGALAVSGLPLLERLSVDLSSESSGWDLLRQHSSVYVPPAHGLATLRSLELRCFVWRHWDALRPGAMHGDNGSDDESDVDEDAASVDGLASESEAGSGDEEGEEEEEEEEEGEEEEGVPMSEDEGSVAGSDGGDDASQSDSDSDDGEGAHDGPLEGMVEGVYHIGGHPAVDLPLFEQHGVAQGPGRAAGGATEAEEAAAVTGLEQRYIATLLERLPTVTSILFSDYMGLISPPAKDSKQAGAGGVGPAPGGERVLCTIGGQAWERTLTETPIEGGISQNDVLYTRV